MHQPLPITEQLLGQTKHSHDHYNGMAAGLDSSYKQSFLMVLRQLHSTTHGGSR
jgi:hypothetical protein